MAHHPSAHICEMFYHQRADYPQQIHSDSDKTNVSLSSSPSGLQSRVKADVSLEKQKTCGQTIVTS